jgi:hypothetical protein
MTAMSTKSRLSSRTPASAAVPSINLSQRLSRLYEQAHQSDFLFASPLGPFHDGVGERSVPRFVYFGPHTSQESLRLSVLAGFGRHDRAAVQALFAFIEGLALRPDIGQSLNVSFFPVVNVSGLLGGAEDRDLTDEHWGRSDRPEISLLNQDSRLCGYQGFVRVTTTADDEPSARVRSVISTTANTSDVQVYSSVDFRPWPVCFETVHAGSVNSGPLSIADDLPFAPFEVELALPADWPQRTADRALGVILKRLIVRYRAFLAYGQHL